MPVEGLQLARDVLGLGDQVRLVGVLGNHAQRLALATPADHHRDPRHGRRDVEGVTDLVAVAGEGHPLAAQHRDDDLQGLLELLEAIGERAELDAEGIVLELEPPGSDAQLGAAAGDDVEGRDRLRGSWKKWSITSTVSKPDSSASRA